MTKLRTIAYESLYGIWIASILFGFLIIPVLSIVSYFIFKRHLTSQFILWLSISALFLHIIAFSTFFPSYQDSIIKEKEKEVKLNTVLIDNAINEYVNRNESFPDTLEDLLISGVLDILPDNPFTGKSIKLVHLNDSDFQGNLTLIIDNDCYYLLGYGHKSHKGYDFDNDGKPDHVIIIRTNCDHNFTSSQ